MRSLTRVRSARVAQAVWLVTAITGTVLIAAGPISQWTALQTVCHPDSACRGFQLDPAAAATLAQHGISLADYAVLSAVAFALVWLLWYGLSALIILRKADDRGAVLAAFFLLLFPLYAASAWLPSSSIGPIWVGGIFIPLLLLFALLFPDGRFAPHWTRWLALSIVVFFGVVYLPLPTAVINAGLFVVVPLFLAVIAAQVHRYRAVSTWTQRQQTKWAVFGLGVGLLSLLGYWIIPIALSIPSTNGSLYGAFSVTAASIAISAIPASIGIAMLRSRLWDIDRVINHALVYGALTLGAIYVGGVIGLQALFRLVTGSSSGLAVAVSTLAIAALFQPLRRRIQTGIDRRFYRSKYNAEKTLAAFGERMRDEVDLTQLSQDLTTVVSDALHPKHVSLWLRQKERV